MKGVRYACALLLAGSVFVAGCSGSGSDSGADDAAPAASSNDPVACVDNASPPTGTEYVVAPVGATASSSDSQTLPSAVYDYDAAVPYWNSGGSAPQWIMLDLGSPRAVTEVRLCVAQTKDGLASHQIYGGLTPAGLELVADVTGPASSGQVLTAQMSPTAPALVQYLKIATSTSPSTVAWGKIVVRARATNVPQYFGYYADAFSWLTSVTAEVIDHVNVSWVSSDLANLSTLMASLQYAQSQGLKVALAIPTEVFFEQDLSLTAGYAGNWAAFADQIRPYEASLAFLNPIDEPYSQAKLTGISAAGMKSRLETIGALIKNTFPAIPVAFSFSAIDFDTTDSAFADLQNPLPANYDLFEFDCYGSWDLCGESTYHSVHSIPWYVDQIKSKLSQGQRIVLFADAFVRQASPADPAQDEAQAVLRLNRADQYYQLALSDASIAGLFGFLYQNDYVEASQRFLGVKNWPALQSKYRDMGRIITGK